MNWLRSFWSVIRRHPFLSGAAITVGIFIIAAIGARMWINSDGGRAYALSQIDGRTVGSLGTLSARGLTGDPLTEVHLAHLSIADDQGVWLVASDIRLKWTPRALVSRHVDLNLLSAGELSIARRPVTASSDSGAGSGQWSVELDDLAIGKLDLAEGVAGPAAAFSVAGRFASVTDGTLDTQLDISPLEGMGDRFKLDAKRNAAGQFMMNAQGTAPAGGTFATLLHLEDGQDATLTASADGTLKEGDGYFLLRISDEDAAAVTAKIVDGRLTANADVNALTLPLPDTIRTLAGANARVILGADIKKHLADFDLSGKFASGDLTLAGQADIDEKTLNGPAALKLDFTGLDAVAGLAARLVLDGNLTVDDGFHHMPGKQHWLPTRAPICSSASWRARWTPRSDRNASPSKGP
jgi:translocation and assembly module TamB